MKTRKWSLFKKVVLFDNATSKMSTVKKNHLLQWFGTMEVHFSRSAQFRWCGGNRKRESYNQKVKEMFPLQILQNVFPLMVEFSFFPFPEKDSRNQNRRSLIILFPKHGDRTESLKGIFLYQLGPNVEFRIVSPGSLWNLRAWQTGFPSVTGRILSVARGTLCDR